MKVYFAPCGIGLGHVTRCEPIIRKLQNAGIDAVVSTYLDGLAYSQSRGLSTVAAYPISFSVKTDGTVDFKRTAAASGVSLGVRTFLRQLVREIRNMKHHRPAIVVSDTRASSVIAAKLLGIRSIVILNQFTIKIVRRPSVKSYKIFDRIFFLIANLLWVFVSGIISYVWTLCDAIIIPDLPSPMTISLGNLRIHPRYRNKVHFLGPLVSRSPSGPSQRNTVVKKIGFKSNQLIVYAALSGPSNEKIFLESKLPELLNQLPDEFQPIMTLGSPNGRTEMIRKGRLVLCEWASEQLKLLEACHIVIGRAGHGTIMKALMYGKPMVLIPTPDHTEQIGNAKRCVELGIARVLQQQELSYETLASALKDIYETQGYFARASEISNLLGKMNGLEKVTGIITNSMKTANSPPQ